MNNDIHYGRKRSGIRRELVKTIEAWLESIDDEAVRKSAEKDVIVTGGAIASMLLGEPINDYDVYFRTQKTTRIVAQYYCDKFNAKRVLKVGSGVNAYKPMVSSAVMPNIKGVEEDRVVIALQSAGVASEDQTEYNYFEGLSEDATAEFAESLMNESTKPSDKYRPIFLSQNAVTLSDKFQIVIRFYGEPDKIHDNYDFIHAMCYWDHANKRLELPAEALESLLCRHLMYRGSLYPIASIFRMKKFLERGWRITAGQQLKIMWQISEINLKDPVILREQLTGVDQAYMHQLIEALKDVEPEKINSTYVAAIIDKIFD